jgi:hypothetical protein
MKKQSKVQPKQQQPLRVVDTKELETVAGGIKVGTINPPTGGTGTPTP